MGYPMLDPEHDLKGATPEKLARALFRRRDLSICAAPDRIAVGRTTGW